MQSTYAYVMKEIFKLTLLIKVLKDCLDLLQILGRELDRRRGPAAHFGLRHLGDWFLLKFWLNSEISQHSVVFHTFKISGRAKAKDAISQN